MYSIANPAGHFLQFFKISSCFPSLSRVQYSKPIFMSQFLQTSQTTTPSDIAKCFFLPRPSQFERILSKVLIWKMLLASGIRVTIVVNLGELLLLGRVQGSNERKKGPNLEAVPSTGFFFSFDRSFFFELCELKVESFLRNSKKSTSQQTWVDTGGQRG